MRSGEFAVVDRGWDGPFFWCFDGLVVRAPGVDNMTTALADLYESGNFREALNRLE